MNTGHGSLDYCDICGGPCEEGRIVIGAWFWPKALLALVCLYVLVRGFGYVLAQGFLDAMRGAR
jgi:hypothetical protein